MPGLEGFIAGTSGGPALAVGEGAVVSSASAATSANLAFASSLQGVTTGIVGAVRGLERLSSQYIGMTTNIANAINVLRGYNDVLNRTRMLTDANAKDLGYLSSQVEKTVEGTTFLRRELLAINLQWGHLLITH